MLVHAGFAEPVMDMERITLTWETPQRLLEELRELGANLHPARFPALRGARWKQRLLDELARALRQPDGRLALTFEIIYGHAVKPAPRSGWATTARSRSTTCGPCCTRGKPDRELTCACCLSKVNAARPQMWQEEPRYNPRLIFERHRVESGISFRHRPGPEHPLVPEAQLLGHAGPIGLALWLAVRRVAGDWDLFLVPGGACWSFRLPRSSWPRSARLSWRMRGMRPMARRFRCRAGSWWSSWRTRATCERAEFDRDWVRVEPGASDRSLVELSAQGRRVNVGRYLRPELRPVLAQEIRRALRERSAVEGRAGVDRPMGRRDLI